MNNKRMLLIIFITSLFLAFITGGRSFYNTAIFLLIIFAINYFLVKNNLKKIDSNFAINREEHLVLEEVKFKYILVNKSIIPLHRAKINLILSKEFAMLSSETEILSFKANQIIELKRSFIIEKRGYYEIGKLELEVSDVFGIFVKRRELDKSINIKVYPRIKKLDKLKNEMSAFLGNVESNKSSLDDFTNIKSLREYVVGDNPRNIHFKLSARAGKTFVKNYYDSNYRELVILVDGELNAENISDSKKSNKSEELCVSLSLSISRYILENSGEIQYILTNKSNLNRKYKSIDAYSSLLEVLMLSAFDGEKSLNNYLGNILHNIRKTSSFLIVSRVMNEAIHDKLLSLKKQGSYICFYLVDVSYQKNSLLSKELEYLFLSLKASGISVFIIGDLDQL